MGISEQEAQDLGTTLVRLMKIFGAVKQHAPKVHPGVDTAAYPILFNLSEGPRRVSSLADCVHSDVSTVSRQVSALVVHGLIDKLGDPEDRRASILSLTDAGRDLIQRVRLQRVEWFQSMLSDWDSREVEVLRASLDRFTTAVEGSKDGLLAMHHRTTTITKEPS